MLKKNFNITENTKILICCHKKCELPQDEIFLPIQVGAAISNEDLGIQRDDRVNGEVCDNISSKNKNYCELTAVYWAWKNIKKLYPDLEYIGLNHYRRYFSFDKKNFSDDSIIKSTSLVANYKIDKKKLSKLLQKGYTIVAKPRVYQYSLSVDYACCHVSDDLRLLQKIIHELTPEYDEAFFSAIICNNKLSPYNMTVIGLRNFDDYCDWLFKILFEAEKRINISNYNPVQARIFGYMAERLFNVWLYKNSKKVKKLNIYKFDDSSKQNVLRQFIYKIRNSILFFGTQPFRKTISEKYLNSLKNDWEMKGF